MGRAILLLYRSARQPTMAEAGRALENAAARPGLSLLATEDPFVGSDEIRHRAAGRAGARTEVLDGSGTLVDDPGPGPRCCGPQPLLGDARLIQCFDDHVAGLGPGGDDRAAASRSWVCGTRTAVDPTPVRCSH